MNHDAYVVRKDSDQNTHVLKRFVGYTASGNKKFEEVAYSRHPERLKAVCCLLNAGLYVQAAYAAGGIEQ